jgi:hypothetical protein
VNLVHLGERFRIRLQVLALIQPRTGCPKFVGKNVIPLHMNQKISAMRERGRTRGLKSSREGVGRNWIGLHFAAASRHLRSYTSERVCSDVETDEKVQEEIPVRKVPLVTRSRGVQSA